MRTRSWLTIGMFPPDEPEARSRLWRARQAVSPEAGRLPNVFRRVAFCKSAVRLAATRLPADRTVAVPLDEALLALRRSPRFGNVQTVLPKTPCKRIGRKAGFLRVGSGRARVAVNGRLR
jgi:hypothetical protein